MEKDEKGKNLEIWKLVEATDPKYTRFFEYGNGKKLTTIDAYYQIKVATALWGPYGSSWGFKNISITQFDKTAVYKAIFYYSQGEFEIINSIGIAEKDFAKKLETDTLTKALSRLGFNADIFMGKFDDNRYVEEMKKRFNGKNNNQPLADTNPTSKSSTTATQTQNVDSVETKTSDIANALKQHGLNLIAQEGVYVVRGKNTFAKKNVIKSLGFQFSSKRRIWWREIA